MQYADARSLRAALEARLKKQALDTGVALDRLRKECAHQRLLARLAAVSPPDSWALKGGLALITRLGSSAHEVLIGAAKETFGLRATLWPPQLQPPPSSWKRAWAAYHAEHKLRWSTLESANQALQLFWGPVLRGTPTLRWSAEHWRWAEI